MRFWREYRPATVAVAPSVLALLVAAAGVMLLFSGATPSDPMRFLWLAQYTPLILIEISHFLSSILGLALVMMAFGLSRRLDAARMASLLLLPVAAMLALLKGFEWEEAAILMTVFVCPAAVPRSVSQGRAADPHGGDARLDGLGHRGHGRRGDRRLVVVPERRLRPEDLPRRHLRPRRRRRPRGALFGGGGGAAAGVRPLAPGGDAGAAARWPATTIPTFSKVRAILAAAENAEPGSNLALLGDKRFLFSESGGSFLMFGVRGRSWIAMGPPVGRRDERTELFWRFRELADAHAARPGFYALGPDDLPDLVDLGFSIQKIGESAAVPLASFSLEGRRARQPAPQLAQDRRGRRAASRCWAPIGSARRWTSCARLRRLARAPRRATRRPSAWATSIRPTSAEFPVAVARVDGRIVAFATLWTTAQQERVLDRPDALRRRRAEGRDGLPVRRADRLGRRPGLPGVRVRHGAAGGARGPAAGADHVAGRPAAVRARRGHLQFPGRAPLTRTSTTRSGRRATSPRRASGRSRSCWPTSA